MHFSSALLFILFAAVTVRGKVGMKLFFAAAMLAGVLLMPGYVAEKSDLYSSVTAPNVFSGLLFLILQFGLLGIIALFRKDFDVPRAGFWLCIVISLAFYGITQITYAGIRFQLLILYLLIVLLMRQYAPKRSGVSRALVVCLFVVGVVAFAGRLHNMQDEEGTGRSPFLPYRALPSLEEYN